MLSCPGALPSLLRPGISGYVRDDDPLPVNVREAPGRSSPKIGEIPTNMSFTVLEGPACRDTIAWFRVSYGGSATGWIAEGDDNYFVSPLTTNPPNQPPPPGQENRILTVNCPVLVEDEFIDGTSFNDWFQDEEEGTQSNERIVEDAYQLRLNFMPANREELTTWGSLRGYTFREGRVEAVIRVDKFADEDSRTGLWLRYQDENHFLAFTIRSDGSYYIGRFVQGEYTDLTRWTQAKAIRTGDGAINTLRVDIQDDQFNFYINGVLLSSVYDSTFVEGRLAFFGASRVVPNQFDLDYVRVCQA